MPAIRAAITHPEAFYNFSYLIETADKQNTLYDIFLQKTVGQILSVPPTFL